MPSLCLVSDTHRHHRELRLPDAELLIHAGDFCSFRQNDLQVLADVDEWFAGSGVEHVLCTGGNHDHELASGGFYFQHAEFLRDRLIEVSGLAVYGSPWVPDLLGHAFYASDEELAEKWRQIPSGLDVLVTHTPPAGILDQPHGSARSIGCRHLREELRRIRPRLHVFGHVHAAYGQVKDNGTLYVNAAVVAGPRSELAHPPVKVTL